MPFTYDGYKHTTTSGRRPKGYWVGTEYIKLSYMEIFTKQAFEDALQVYDKNGNPAWTCLGLIDGEYQYTFPVPGTNKRVVIRSSVGINERSAPCGENSIRLWLEYKWHGAWRPLHKCDQLTRRTSGWRRRMMRKLRELIEYARAD